MDDPKKRKEDEFDLTDEEKIELANVTIEAIRNAKKGYSLITTLETTIGALWVTKFFGWKPMMLMHGNRTFKNFEKRLKVDFQKDPLFVPEGIIASTSIAWKLMGNVKKFWNVMRGDMPGIRNARLVDEGEDESTVDENKQ